MKKIKKNLPTAIRNMFIFLVVLFCIVKGIDLFYTYKNTKKDIKAAESSDEANLVFLMDVEKTDIRDYACVETSTTVLDYVKKHNPGFIVNISDYPLTRDMNDETMYDAETKNIVFIGDSFIWGQGSINRNELFWQLLEEDLRAEGYNVRVYCAAMGGANAYEELNWLLNTNLIKDLKADMVIFGYMYNDAIPLDKDNSTRLNDEEGTPEFFRILRPIKNLFPSLYTNIQMLGYLQTPLNEKFGVRYYIEGVAPLTGITKTEYIKNFTIPLSHFAENSSIPIIVMTLPNEPKSPLLKIHYKQLKEIYSDFNNISLYDCFHEYSYDFASSKHKDNYQVNPADGHPGSATNRFFADYIKDFLIKDYADVLGEPSSDVRTASGIRINDCTPYSLGLNEISREGTYAEYTFEYPSETKQYDWYGVEFDKYFLTAPIGEDYVKLCFDVPVSITSIELNGEKLESASVYFTRINEKLNYDDHSFTLAEQNGTDIWTGFGDARVTSLCIHADMADRNGGKLTLKINTAGEEK